MKKLVLSIVLLFAVVALVNAQNEATKTFNLKMTVDKYIEIGTCPQCLNFGVTDHVVNGVSHEQLLDSYKNVDEFAYANCKFSITVSGENADEQGVPRFVRKETGSHGGAFDVLPTQHEIRLIVNGEMLQISEGRRDAANFPFTYNANEAPHNGQIRMYMYTSANRYAEGGVSLKATQLDRDFANEDSADAGDYECTMTTTLTAL